MTIASPGFASAATTSSRIASSLPNGYQLITSSNISSTGPFPPQPSVSRNSRPSSSRLASAGSKTASFLASLGRWSRWGTSPTNPGPSSNVTSIALTSGRSHSSYARDPQPLLIPSYASSPRNLAAAGNREKVKQWIRDEAKAFETKYFSSGDGDKTDLGSDSHPAMSTLNKLNIAVESFGKKDSSSALEDIKTVLMGGDISPFELMHSGVVDKLLVFLTRNEDGIRDERIKSFLTVFLGVQTNPPGAKANKALVAANILDPEPLAVLVSKLNACVSQLEQFPTNIQNVIGTETGSIRGTSALKFFNTHQLKCNLQRHPSCHNLKQWKGGPVKIDPLALVQAIERYLVIRGYGRIREDEDGDSDDDNSDEEFDDNMTAMMLTQGQGRHRLQFFIGEQALPYNMTVYQAIRQFTGHSAHEADADNEGPMSHANMWIQTHTIFYKPFAETSGQTSSPPGAASSSSNRTTAACPIPSSTSGRNGKRGAKNSSPKRKDELWLEGRVPRVQSPVEPYLESRLPMSMGFNDSSADAIVLLRVLYALNRHWGWYSFPSQSCKPAISNSDFINLKLTAKVNRQLQDPLSIMTGNLPSWIWTLANACPFLFPFETRHLLFYIHCFDRDRALQRLLDSTPGMNSNDSTERVTPRLDRRKKTVSREDLLRQAETVLQDVGSSKALLEVQYENEVGTGLGPTLEFYALVSQELQRAELDMWRGEVSSTFLKGNIWINIFLTIGCDIDSGCIPILQFKGQVIGRNPNYSGQRKIRSGQRCQSHKVHLLAARLVPNSFGSKR